MQIQFTDVNLTVDRVESLGIAELIKIHPLTDVEIFRPARD